MPGEEWREFKARDRKYTVNVHWHHILNHTYPDMYTTDIKISHSLFPPRTTASDIERYIREAIEQYPNGKSRADMRDGHCRLARQKQGGFRGVRRARFVRCPMPNGCTYVCRRELARLATNRISSTAIRMLSACSSASSRWRPIKRETGGGSTLYSVDW
jgi:hypothetical protein